MDHVGGVAVILMYNISQIKEQYKEFVPQDFCLLETSICSCQKHVIKICRGCCARERTCRNSPTKYRRALPSFQEVVKLLYFTLTVHRSESFSKTDQNLQERSLESCGLSSLSFSCQVTRQTERLHKHIIVFHQYTDFGISSLS